MSKKLVIMQRLTRLLEGPIDYEWTDTDGNAQSVTYDLTGKVYRGRKFLTPTDVPDYAVSIMESPRPATGTPVGYNNQVRLNDWTLNVQGFPVDDKDNPSDPAYLMADAISQRLQRIISCGRTDPTTGDPGRPDYPDDYMLGGLVTGLTITDSVVLPAQENLSRFAFFYIPVIVSFVRS